ncbi:hypothetical protein CEXT_629031 [Caerostris extrusa]|uniref:Uncharacterized protein n=1 Tax=Caerostris extrusa TaxID=172846 RepID=A0AAV4P218_CAEEX|nr:hypothetical protein CEXT_629031 [Caerostris extrusa]
MFELLEVFGFCRMFGGAFQCRGWMEIMEYTMEGGIDENSTLDAEKYSLGCTDSRESFIQQWNTMEHLTLFWNILNGCH